MGSGDEGGGGQESSSKKVYVSVKDRRKERLIKLGRITAVKDEEDRLQATSSGANSSGANSSDEDNDGQGEISGKGSPMPPPPEVEIEAAKDVSLLLQHSKLKKLAESRQESEIDKQVLSLTPWLYVYFFLVHLQIHLPLLFTFYSLY